MAAGRLTYDAGAPSAEVHTVFDLASLTKVLATTPLAMSLVDEGRLDLGTPVGDIVPEWRGDDREAATVADLLSHSSGLPAHRPLHRLCTGRAEFERAICGQALDYPPGRSSLYSDLGFLLLGFLLERAVGEPLDTQFARMCARLAASSGRTAGAGTASPDDVRFRPPDDWAVRIAPTRPAPSNPGVPHDENAAALGGVAGHAGLFGTAPGVGVMARATLRAVLSAGGEPAIARRETALRFVSRVEVPGSSRALGWDTMLPTSSCGTMMSVCAFGHTGFTGTSLWIDPEAGIYAVLLTNRVYPEPGGADAINGLRRAFHDAVMAEGPFSNRTG